MERIKKALGRLGAELVLAAGAAAVAVGVGLIYFPAGLIAGGVLAMAGAALSIIGGGEGR